MVHPLRAILALVTGMVLLSCGSSSNTNALAKPGTSAVVITDIFPPIPPNPPTDSQVSAVAVQSDGQIIAAGFANNGTQNLFTLARYNSSDGKLDSSFNGTGIDTTAIGPGNAEAKALAVQAADQKLVVAGYSYNGSQYVFAVARYNPDGTLDTGFGSGGIVTTQIGSYDDRALAVTIQSVGGQEKIVAAGYSSVNNGTAVQSRIALVRYNSDGTLDVGFGTNGEVITDPNVVPVPANCNPSDPSNPSPCPPPTGVQANALTIQPDPNLSNNDLLVVAGVAYGMSVINGKKVTDQNVILVARYMENGSPDTTFYGGDPSNTTGIVTTAIGTDYENDEAKAVGIDVNGNVVVAGSALTTQRTVAVVRYTSNGSLDTNFNSKGTVTTPIDTHAGATALGFYTNPNLINNPQGNQQIIVAGTAYNKTYGEFVMARYNPDGHLDTKFGSGGKVTTEIRYGAGAFGLAIQSGGDPGIDGFPIVAGFSQGYTNPPPQTQLPSAFTLARYNTDGKLDTNFPPQP
ncbi:MAG TPA: delta-60 repeat domain-containing protein [Nitrospiria bacterium]|nr:delta-60 repeat domain-containing protein [Nitrospiria bacterium]